MIIRAFQGNERALGTSHIATNKTRLFSRAFLLLIVNFFAMFHGSQ